VNKTVIFSVESCKGVQNTGRWPSGVCGRYVGRKSIQCTECSNCEKWIYEKYSGIRDSMIKASMSCV